MTLSKAVGDLQRLGIKRSRIESPGRFWPGLFVFVSFIENQRVDLPGT